MTKIKNIFKKDIDRDIRGVIKIGQDSEKIKKQELEEYVITDELKNDFTRFFDAMIKVLMYLQIKWEHGLVVFLVQVNHTS